MCSGTLKSACTVGQGIVVWAVSLNRRSRGAGGRMKPASVARKHATSRKGKEKVVEEDGDGDEDVEISTFDSEEEDINSADICDDDGDAEW